MSPPHYLNSVVPLRETQPTDNNMGMNYYTGTTDTFSIFQTSNSRRSRNENSKICWAEVNDSKRGTYNHHASSLPEKSIRSDAMGIHGCPIGLFLAASIRKQNVLDTLRPKEIHEDFDVVFDTRELNKITKESRMEWLIEAVGGEKILPTTSCSNHNVSQKENKFRRFVSRLGRSFRKLLNRGRVGLA